jgi:glycosyltransferase involved in cell wall biosynthesis
MACINADIAIAPLEDKEFNRNKSSVKFYEYSALKIPSVVSNVPPYADEVQEKVNGLLFKTPDEFMRKVSALIDDPLLRRELGENAYAWVKEHRDVRVIAKDWVEVIKKTVEAMKK